MTDPSEVLLEKTTDFATDLAATVSAFVDRECAFVATVRDAKVHISLEDSAGIPLQVAGATHLTMVIEMECSWDSAHKYLAIDESKLHVFPGTRTNKEPLFRYEYVREPVGGIPSAHLQVHAHRDAFTHAMSSAGRGSKRGKLLSKRSPDEPPAVSNFHFPLGGPRFRPCLEDILETLQLEFGLDTGAGWESALLAGRLRWRRQQVRAVARDSPQEAAGVLRELGYAVSGPELQENLLRLGQL